MCIILRDGADDLFRVVLLEKQRHLRFKMEIIKQRNYNICLLACSLVNWLTRLNDF